MNREAIENRIEQLTRQIEQAERSASAWSKTSNGRDRAKASRILVDSCEKEIEQLREKLSKL
ncbi:MAG: hypothetical protein MK088_06620 [Alteromonas sp.]|nr:hypothetical protein [Gammaproteobacteria bacterium]MCH2256287.1 hypothetical protein [Alteromonas sp.]